MLSALVLSGCAARRPLIAAEQVRPTAVVVVFGTLTVTVNDTTAVTPDIKLEGWPWK